jgi:thermitase
MKKLSRLTPVILVLSLIAGIIGWSGTVLAQSEGQGEYDRYIVGFKPGVTAERMAQIQEKAGCKVEFNLSQIHAQVVKIPHSRMLSAQSATYDTAGEIEFIEPDYIASATEIPNDARFSSEWGMTIIQAPQAWDITHGSSTVKIAILDTGIDADHVDLAGKVVAAQNFSTSSTTDDKQGHGTHVAGIAAGITNNGTGVAGVAYKASLMNVKVLGDDGSGYHSAIAQGIIWAADNGANVINMSLGGASGSTALQQAVDYAWSKGVVMVAAAGNEGISSPSYPGYYTNAIAVAATDSNDRLYAFSNRGSWVDVAAPGSALSTVPNNGYSTLSGTSMASPFVAGLAGLVCAVTSDTNGDGKINDEVRARIENNTDSIGTTAIAHGRINAFKAISNGLSAPITNSPPVLAPIGHKTVKVGNTLAFQVSASDVNGGLLSYSSSNLPAGATFESSTATFSWTPTVPGTYSGIHFEVSDGQGGLDSEYVTINVNAVDTNTMWVDSINFTPGGSYLYITVKVVNPQLVVSAQVSLRLQVGNYSVSATKSTDSNGEVMFRVYPAVVGTTYTTTITGLVGSGYTWESTRGINSASYTMPAR